MDIAVRYRVTMNDWQARPVPCDASAMEDADYHRLAALRAGIRRYLAWAEGVAREHGMTPAQVQLALVIRTHEDPAGPTLTDLADALLLRHHSAVGLVDRAEQAGFVHRARDPERPSRVHVELTPAGRERLEALGELHVAWLAEHGADLGGTMTAFAQ